LCVPHCECSHGQGLFTIDGVKLFWVNVVRKKCEMVLVLSNGNDWSVFHKVNPPCIETWIFKSSIPLEILANEILVVQGWKVINQCKVVFIPWA